EDTLREWIVNDGVRIFVRLDSVQDFERGEIEHDGIAAAAVGGEAFVEFIGQGDAVGSLGVWNVADNFPLVGIHDDVVRAARDEQAMRGRIDFQIIPAAGSAELHFLDEMVAGAASRLCSGRNANSGEQSKKKKRETSASTNMLIRRGKPPVGLRGAWRTEGDDVTWKINARKMAASE